MFLFAHEGHVHTDQIAPAKPTNNYSMNYAGYVILLIGLLLLLAGIMCLLSALSNKSNKTETPE